MCRHAQCDLHTTPNILNIALATKCTTPFQLYNNGNVATAEHCTSNLTLNQFISLCGKMDGVNPNAINVLQYMDGTPYYRVDLYFSGCSKLMTLNSYIDIVNCWDLNFTAELKMPKVKNVP